MRITYSLAIRFIRIFMKIVGNYQLEGKENLQNWKPCIIAANHISYFDPPFIGSILGQEIYYLAKKELFKNKFLNRFFRYYNCIPVNRGVIDRSALKKVKEILNDGESILLFPEGSRKSFTARPGIGLIAYETGIPILPVRIENSTAMKHCLLRKIKLRIIIGKLIETTEYQKLPAVKDTYKLIAQDVLDAISKL